MLLTFLCVAQVTGYISTVLLQALATRCHVNSFIPVCSLTFIVAIAAQGVVASAILAALISYLFRTYLAKLLHINNMWTVF